MFKDIFLLLTTGFIIFWFFKDYKKAIIWYLIFYAFISIVGLNRVIYYENIVIPLLLLVVLSFKFTKVSKTNIYYVIFLIYMLFITYINGLTILDEASRGMYLFVILLIFSKYLFKNADYTTKIVFFIWLITLGYAFNTLIYGESLFSVTNINSEERNMVLDTGIQGSNASDKGVDLNYFSSGQAIGAMISLMFIIYRKQLLSIVTIPPYLKTIFSNVAFTLVLHLLFALEVWLVFRGLSRGALLVFFAGMVAFIFVMRKQKYLLYGGLILVVSYFIMNKIGIVDLLMERFTKDESGTSGRDLIFIGLFGSVYGHGGILQIIFGGGNGWPWWEFWSDNFWDKGTIPSSHNQWLSMFVNVGFLGLTLFFIPLYKGIRNNIKHNNPINNIRIVLFVCVFAESLSLEPLIYSRYVWFILALAATYTPNMKLTSTRNKLPKSFFNQFNYRNIPVTKRNETNMQQK